jgi:tRNA(Arg) A34 adenosine deaminase TadA
MTDSRGREFLRAGVAEVHRSLREGDIPIGWVIVHAGKSSAVARNRRAQKGIQMMHDFIHTHPALSNEDIGE